MLRVYSFFSRLSSAFSDSSISSAGADEAGTATGTRAAWCR